MHLNATPQLVPCRSKRLSRLSRIDFLIPFHTLHTGVVTQAVQVRRYALAVR